MLEVAKQFLLVNFFWFSLPLIGFFILKISEKYIKNKKIIPIVQLANGQHIFLRFLIAFGVSAFIFSVLSLVFYILNAPVILLTIIYLTLLASAIIWVIRNFVRSLFVTRQLDILGIARQPLVVKLCFMFFCLLLAMDFTVSAYIGSYAQVSADTYVHLSRIVSLIHQGFTEQSGFFSGLAESGYHYNALYAFHALGAQVTNLQPFEFWRYSFGFFRLIQWLAVFVLAAYILRKWIMSVKYLALWSVLATVLAMGIYSAFFYTAVYPNQLVHVWMMLLVLALSTYEYGKKEMGLVIGSLAFMITMTHPAYAFMTAMFLGLVLVVRLVREGMQLFKCRETLVVYGISMFILMLGPVKTLLYPNRMSAEQVEIGAFPIVEVLGMSIKDPLVGLPSSLSGWALLLLGIVGSIFLLARLWGHKRQFAIVASLIFFYLLIMYVPPIFSFINLILPLWVMDRFSAVNILVHVQVFLGIYAIFSLLVYVLKKIKMKPYITKVLSLNNLTIVFAMGILLASGYFGYSSYKVLADNRPGNAHYYSFMDSTYENLKSNLGGEKLVVATQGDSYFLAAILPIDVVAIEPGHMTPVTSVNDRIECQKHILKTLDPASLKQIEASMVVLAKYEKDTATQKIKADYLPYLRLVNEDANFYVYEVKPDRLSDLNYNTEPFSACREYKAVEAH